jgi:hypothetical protein
VSCCGAGRDIVHCSHLDCGGDFVQILGVLRVLNTLIKCDEGIINLHKINVFKN